MGDYVIRTEKPASEFLSSKSENEIANEIIAIPGRHSEEEQEPSCVDDIIVEKCSYHYGRKKQKPLLDMRFVDRDDLEEPLHKLPEGKCIDVSDYLTSLPQSFEKNLIRVFCRDDDPKKRDLLRHKFEQWKETGSANAATPYNRYEAFQAEVRAYDEETSMDGGSSPRGHGAPSSSGLPCLTQDSEDDENPRKPPRSDQVDSSPISFSLPQACIPTNES